MATAFDRHVLRRWRLESKHTPEQVCVLVPMSYPYLRGIEDGIRTSPSLVLLTRLAEVYGHDVSELLTDDLDRVSAAEPRRGGRRAPDPAGAR